MTMAEVQELLNCLARHQAEGTSGELEHINIGAHRLQDIFQVASAHRGVIRPADFGDSPAARLELAVIDSKEGKCPLIKIIFRLAYHISSFSNYLIFPSRLVSSLTGIISR